MKKIITLFLVVAAFATKAQSSFEYNYDAAGNRIQRKVIVLDPNREGEKIIKDEDNRFLFTLFPNPTEGLLTIEAEEKFLSLSGKKALVYDLKGTVVSEIDISNTTIPVDLKKRESGTYIIKILGDGYAKEWKVIKL